MATELTVREMYDRLASRIEELAERMESALSELAEVITEAELERQREARYDAAQAAARARQAAYDLL